MLLSVRLLGCGKAWSALLVKEREGFGREDKENREGFVVFLDVNCLHTKDTIL